MQLGMQTSSVSLDRAPSLASPGLWEEQLARFRKKEVNQKAVVGGRVCRIDEAEEPSEIIWENIDTTLFQRYFGQGRSKK